MRLRPLPLLVAAFSVCCSIGAAAQSPAQFYKGKTVKLSVGTSAGGGTDVIARLLARHMSRYIPGEPTIVVQNMPGAGGIVGANLIANTAVRDGTEISTIERAIPQLALMGDPKAKFDPLALTWIGCQSSYQDDAFMLFINTSNPVMTAAELRGGDKKIVLGASRQGSTNLTFALIAKQVLGLNVVAIPGYEGTAKITLAQQAGEVDGQLMGIVSLRASQRHLWDDKLVRPLVQFARTTRHPLLPDIPTGRELAPSPEALALIEFAELPFFMAQSYVAPPAIPADRAEALRAAFNATMKDASYVEEAKKLGIDHSPIGYAEIEGLLRKAAATPKRVVDQFAAIVNTQ
jgi:tripartite-type tricarboxylate transporter receptor subunit TctC